MLWEWMDVPCIAGSAPSAAVIGTRGALCSLRLGSGGGRWGDGCGPSSERPDGSPVPSLAARDLPGGRRRGHLRVQVRDLLPGQAAALVRDREGTVDVALSSRGVREEMLICSLGESPPPTQGPPAKGTLSLPPSHARSLRSHAGVSWKYISSRFLLDREAGLSWRQMREALKDTDGVSLPGLVYV